MNEGVDAAIVKVLDWEPDGEQALIAAGPAGAERVFDLYYGRAKASLDTKARGRDLVDGWSAALHIAATVAPEAFLARLKGDVGITEVVILGGIDDPRATAVLCEQAAHEDYVHRYNAVKALAGHSNPKAREAIESALGDRDLVVRSAAIRAVADTDPDRGVTLYEAFLREPDLTPLLRQESQWALSYLRKHSRIPKRPW
ncbi:HEAT repeat domain-containing protein [Glycomyces sp. NRRL B-16210]|uniref:HEAT repeat domain-containing protein n=1 Tax=Glycomyces sp. NRRL B-16210 TaxID=1463821 RepID=UPI0004BFB1F5|nr:HEAT repeat domain-containing protein [Glycomyces sp. NRRL B-16210]